MNHEQSLNKKELEAPLISKYNNYEKMNLSKVTKICLYLGFISFGGPIAHIGIFKKLLIEDRKFLSESEFTDLFNICNVIPGPTSSQLITAIMTIKTKSVFAGLVSFLCFNMPALIFMILLANLLQNTFRIQEFSSLSPENYTWHYLILLFFLGVCQSAVANIFQAAFTLSDKIKNNSLQLLLLLGSSIIFSLRGDHISMILIMITCGLITVFKSDEKMLLNIIQNKKEYMNNNPNSQYNSEEENSWFLGFPSLITWIIIAILFLTSKFVLNLNLFLSDKNLQISEAFFRIGSIIVGGGHVVIPMMMTEFVKTNLITQTDVLNGFSLVSLMPGPMFNIAGYIGTIINGTFSGFLSAFSIFLPGMLFMFFIIGKLDFLFSSPKIQFFIRGASTAGIGFIFAAAFMIFLETTINSLHSNIITGTFNIFVCFYLLKNTKIILPLILFIGGSNYILLRFVSFYLYK